MQENFKFDIQLFSEDAGGSETVGGAVQQDAGSQTPSQVETTAPVEPTATTPAQEHQPESLADATSKTAFRMNEDGDIDILLGREAEEWLATLEKEEGEPQQQDPAQEPKQEQQQEPQQEPDKANQIDLDAKYVVTVDGENVEVTLQELLSGYMRQSDYTKKTQQVKEIERQLQQPPVQHQEPQAPQVPVNTIPSSQWLPNLDKVDLTNFAEFNKYLTECAVNLAKSRMGVEDFIEVDVEHQSAFIQARTELATHINDAQVKANTMRSLEFEWRAVEPRFDDVWNHYIGEYKDNLPFKTAREHEEAFREGNRAKINQIIQAAQKDFYSKNVIKPIVQPPKTTPVASVGTVNPDTVPREDKQFDFKDLRKMDDDTLTKFLIDAAGL